MHQIPDSFASFAPARRCAGGVLAALLILASAAGAAAPADRESPASQAAADERFAVADTLRGEGRFQEALTTYRELRDEFAAAGDTARQWRAQLWLADALRRTGEPDASEAALGEAMALAGGEPQRVAATRLGICGLHSYRGESEAAIAECGMALGVAEAIGDRELEARAHFQLGTIHSRRGRYRLSVAATEKALALRRRYGGSPYEMAGVLNSMGIEYAGVGRLGEAEQMYREGLGLAGSFATPWYEFHLHSNLAHLRAASGNMDGALDSIAQSLRGAEELDDVQGMVYAHNSFAEFYLRAGNRTAARRHLEKSLAINEEVSHIHRVIALAMLGEIEAAEDRVEQAQATLAEALALAETSDFSLQGVNIRAALAGVAVARGDAGAAVQWADEAIALAETLGSPDAMIRALEARAAAMEAAGGARAAEAWLEAIDLLESWRGRLVLGDLRMGIAEPRWSIYEGAVRTLLAQGRAAAAFDVAERARARLLLELLAERDASMPDPSPVEQLRRQLRVRYQERVAATADGEIEALDRDIRDLTAALTALEEDARRRDPVTGAARFPQPVRLVEMQAKLLRPGQALLAWFWGDEVVYGWWITGEEVRAARLGSAKSLAARVDFLRGAIERPAGPAWAGAARAAFDALVAPLAPTATEQIFVMADGPLAHVPVEVLIPADDAEPLGATAHITYGPSASVLLSLARSPKPESWERSILVVGNPAVGEGESQPVSSWRDEPLASLPHAALEARSIHGLFRGQRADLLLGRDATLDAWHGLRPERYRFLHFAAHARVSDRRPEQTHLVLAGGHLDLAAIRELQLRTELVTLSACETGLGRRVRGEGIIGLSHAFLAAGARGAVVTLWRIDDEATADFMQHFYRRLHEGDTPAEALLTARRERIGAGNSPPAHWAPFVLVGGL